MVTVIRLSEKSLTYLEKVFEKNLSNLGKLFAILAGFISFMGVFFNKLASPESLSSFLLVRGICNAQISYAIVKATKVRSEWPVSYLKDLTIRSLIGVFCAYLFTQSLNYLELNHFYTLINTQPIFTFWLAYLTMNESYRHDHFICTISAVLGVVLVMNPDYLFFDFTDKHEMYENFQAGVTIALFTAFLRGIIFIYVKKISSHSPHKTLMFFESTRVIIAAFVFVFAAEKLYFLNFRSFFFAILSGLLEYIFHIFNIMAMRYEKASVIGVIDTLTILYGFLIDAIYFKKVPAIGSIFGTIIVLGSALCLMRLK